MVVEVELVPSLAAMVVERLVLEHVVEGGVRLLLGVVGVVLHEQQLVGERLIFLCEAFYETILIVDISR